ncbi:hypothetical protein [Desulfovibrio legallii]|uniref:Uncharacterized protein n=1 Tax=Desulfovibrio legallii TaxID=571438 RepID=A0A1G7K8R0_9BACT|nr:hypothetical protein [Desulfovibrio legallii]SDF33411.1 hypothetical protein SAMN05192586_10410 [Desulfovibrio legallii]
MSKKDGFSDERGHSMSENNTRLLQEYFDKHHDQHLAELHRRNTVRGRMEEAFEKSDGTLPDAFYCFFEGEITASDICIVYMPDFGVNRRTNKKGKIIIEVVSMNTPFERVEDCFEFQLARKTHLMGVKVDILKRQDYCDAICRYYNMQVSWEDAMPIVQRVLFNPIFRQRFLMTTDSATLGGITAKRFLPYAGQVFSFRACALKK